MLLTSLEGVLKGEGIVDLEAFLRPASDTALVLIEADVEDILLSCGCHYVIINIEFN